MKRCSFLLFLLISPSVAVAGWTSGNELYNNLSSRPDEFYMVGLAHGYVTAIADAESKSTSNVVKFLAQNKEFTPEKRTELLMELAPLHACFPRGVTVGQLVAVVKQWLSANPKRWNETASDLVSEALKENFACNTVEDFLK